MTKDTTSGAPKKASPKGGQTREDRLKAALKANMGRRKAQTRARTAQTTENKDHKNGGKDPLMKGE